MTRFEYLENVRAMDAAARRSPVDAAFRGIMALTKEQRDELETRMARAFEAKALDVAVTFKVRK